MNKLSFFLLPLWLVVTFPISNQNKNHIDDGLIAYYSFDNCDARDDSGLGSDGKMFGTVECWCGVKDDGLLLDGKNDYIEFHGFVNKHFNTSDFTISFYFRTIDQSIFKQSLISKRTDCTEEQMLDIQVWQNTLDVDFHETDWKDYEGLSVDTHGSQWYHYALVRKGTKAYSYLNGDLMVEARRCSGVDISNDTPLSIGNSPCIGGSMRRFRGVIDELRVYDRALDLKEVLQLYQENPIEQAQQDCFS